MAAHEGGGNGARRPPAPPLLPTLSLPPRSAAGSLFSAESSPGALTLAASLFPDAPSPAFQGSFTQLLVGAMGYPAASAPAPPSPFPVPHGLSPTAFLGGSPGLFSPTVTYSPQANQQSYYRTVPIFIADTCKDLRAVIETVRLFGRRTAVQQSAYWTAGQGMRSSLLLMTVSCVLGYVWKFSFSARQADKFKKRYPWLGDRPLVPTIKTFQISTNPTTEGLGIISEVPIRYNSVEVILDFHLFDISDFDILIGHPIEKLLNVPETGVLNLKVGKIVTSVPVLQSTNSLTEPLPVPEPIEEVMAISPFEAPESNLDESIEEFNEGVDESGETIDLPKMDQPS
uniref:Uncharacterized protein n=2 Tax=Oryza sativa subsp. japonica TaxID=39947 RepID=Q10IV0_ORYSJ|nr:hypothetical protein LOC_Os03g33012 [Oryza sativa Japonica Group]